MFVEEWKQESTDGLNGDVECYRETHNTKAWNTSLNHILLKTEMLLLYVTHILLYIFQMSVSVKKGPA